MNFLAILRSIEDLIYEIALWIVLTPKTFFMVLFQPGWPQRYLVAESEKELTERYDRYISPILFWAFVCVIPYTLTLDFVLRIVSSPKTEGDKFLKLLTELPLELRFLFFATFLISGPLGFSIGTLWSRRQPISRRHLQRVFYTQCYCFGVAYLLLLPFIAIYILVPLPAGSRFDFLFARHPEALGTYIVSTNSFGLWFFFAELRILREELSINWLKSMGLFLAFLLVAIVLMLGVQTVLYIIVSNLT